MYGWPEETLDLALEFVAREVLRRIEPLTSRLHVNSKTSALTELCSIPGGRKQNEHPGEKRVIRNEWKAWCISCFFTFSYLFPDITLFWEMLEL